MSKFLRLTTLWLWGGFIYYVIELAWRGYSHPSMFVVGGICFLLIGGINNWFSWSMGLVKQALIGAGIVTGTEFMSGLIINSGLGLNIWNYSDMPLNVAGHICLAYSLLWIPMSLIGIVLDDYLRWKLYREERPEYTIGKII